MTKYIPWLIGAYLVYQLVSKKDPIIETDPDGDFESTLTGHRLRGSKNQSI
jgi:hypothetical protein